MQYMLLIYQREEELAKMTADEAGAFMNAYGTFTKEIVASGNFKAGDPLQRVETATTVRVREGKTLKTDGPFAETREQLGGYYLIEAKDLDEAVEYAAKCPAAFVGAMEVRPIVQM
jgi:hypothetical protein